MKTASWWRAWALAPLPSVLLYGARYDELPVELADLFGVLQNPKFHPEGDAFAHTLCVVNQAAAIARRDGLDGDDTLVLVLAALCHDFGKYPTTKLSDAGNWVAPNHDVEGVPLTESFLGGLGFAGALIGRVAELVRRHMAHASVPGQPSARMVRRLAAKVDEAGSSMWELRRVVEADKSGRPPLPACRSAAFELIFGEYLRQATT